MAWSPRGSYFAGLFSGMLLLFLLEFGALFFAAYFFKSAIVGRKAAELQAPPIQPGAMASYDWGVIDAGGANHPFQEFAGKNVFLQFWSPECMACESEIGAMNGLFDATKDKGIEIVAVAVDVKPEELQDTAVRMKIRYPIYSLSSPLPEIFQFTSGPASFIIGRSGLILYKNIGAAKWDDPQVLLYLTMLTTPVPGSKPLDLNAFSPENITPPLKLPEPAAPAPEVSVAPDTASAVEAPSAPSASAPAP